MDPYAMDSDNISVGSLAFTDAESGSGGGKDDDDVSVSSNSPEAIVKRKSRGVGCWKAILLLLLVSFGIFLGVAAYVTQPTGQGSIHAGVVGACFAVLILVFLRYDYLAARRTSMVMDMARRSRNIVDQLFPSVVRDRLLNEGSTRRGSNGGDDPDETVDVETLTKRNTMANQKLGQSGGVNLPSSGRGPTRVKTFLATGSSGAGMLLNDAGAAGDAEPIAELFSDTTVMFADIAGFTAWSSERDPPQVFRLLETVYGAFDELAGRHKVFKVETIGDSYMCVTGLPEPDDGHAIGMCRFAYQCMAKMIEVCQDLEAVLGPGTEDLAMRIGLHSGPVTAGVLRGQKSRFQLFGDTVNTASRMESTGRKGHIQVSMDTAELLMAAGKAHWVSPREDKVVAKGKGEMTTYWLVPRRKGVGRSDSDDEMPAILPSFDSGRESDLTDKRRRGMKKEDHQLSNRKIPSRGEPVTVSNMNTRLRSPTRHVLDDKYSRLVEWNTDVLLQYLSSIVANRSLAPRDSRSLVDHENEPNLLPPPFENVSDVVNLPDFDPSTSTQRRHGASAATLESLRSDIHQLVSEIAVLYNDVSFHNFEHASHVTLAANKLIGKMVSPEGYSDLELFEFTYGISGDPLTQFAIVFAALIHDVGHSGITNAQLVAEESPIAINFKERSVAEQNSLCVAWELLMQPRFKNLRSSIYKTNVERKRFRQVLINAVMATDIADREVLRNRARKWEMAFRQESDDEERPLRASGMRSVRNRKATAVIDHLLQVADIAHTMQHWSIYRRWNDRLFEEMYMAYMDGRASFDPTSIWYKGELAFFDFFVIPLAKKMNDCGVFRSSGGSYLSYAQANRSEWEQNGQEALMSMIESAKVTEPDTADGHNHSESAEQSSAKSSNGYESSGQSDVDSTAPVMEEEGPELSHPAPKKRGSSMKTKPPAVTLSRSRRSASVTSGASRGVQSVGDGGYVSHRVDL